MTTAGANTREIKLEDEDEEAFEKKMRVAVEDAKAPRWESPEAWLVQSNSIDEASDAVE